MTERTWRVCAALALLTYPASSLGAGGIMGTVVDDANNPIEYALVCAVLAADPNVYTGTVTDASGAYTVSDVAAGTYNVKLAALGYAVAAEPNVTVTDDANTIVNFQAAAEATVSGRTTRADPNVPLGGVLVSTTVLVNGVPFYPSASSDANTGEYTLTNLPAGTWSVGGLLQGFAFSPVQVSVSAGQGATGVNLAAAGSSVAGTLTEWGGELPLPDAFVSLIDANNHTAALAKTDQDGAFFLGPVSGGTYRVTYTLGGTEIALSEQIGVQDDESASVGAVEAFGGAVEGFVRDANSGAGLANGQVALFGRADLDPPLGVTRAATTDPNGRYLVDRVPPGRYRVHASAAGHAAGAMSGVETVEGQLTTAPVFYLQIGGGITGKVLDPNGSPIAKASVECAWDPNVGDPNDPNRLAPMGGVTDPNGVFTVIGCATGTYYIRASASGYVSVVKSGIAVNAGQTTSGQDVTLGALSGAGSISGKVYRSDGQTPASRAHLSCRAPGGTWEYGITGSDGSYTLGPLSPGTYEVDAGEAGSGRAVRSGVTVQAGQNTPSQDIVLPGP